MSLFIWLAGGAITVMAAVAVAVITLTGSASKPNRATDPAGPEPAVVDATAPPGQEAEPETKAAAPPEPIVAVIVHPPADAFAPLEAMTFSALEDRIRGKQVGTTKSSAALVGQRGGQRGEFGEFGNSSEYFDDATQTRVSIQQTRVNERIAVDQNDARRKSNPKLDLDLALGKRVEEVVERQNSTATTWSERDGAYRGEFVEGKRSGRWVRRHPNGRLWLAGAYQGDRKSGRFLIHDETGRRIWSGVYNDDQLVRSARPGASQDYQSLAVESEPTLMQFTPDGRRLLLVVDHVLTIVDTSTWDECGAQTLPGKPTSIESTPLGNVLLVSYRKPLTSNSYQTDVLKAVVDGTTATVKWLLPVELQFPTLSADGRLLAGFRRAPGNYSHLEVYDVETQAIRFEHDGTESDNGSTKRIPINFSGASFSADGQWLSTGGSRATYLFNTNDGKIAKRFEYPLSGVSLTARDGWVTGWTKRPTMMGLQRAGIELATGEPFGNGWVAAFDGVSSPDGRFTAEVTRNLTGIKQVSVIDVATGLQTGSWKFEDSDRPHLSDDARLLVLCGEEKSTVWDVRTGAVAQNLPPSNYSEMSANGRVLAARAASPGSNSEDARIQLYALLSDRTRTITPPARFLQMRLSPDGGSLAVSDRELDVNIWDIRDLTAAPLPAPADPSAPATDPFHDWRTVGLTDLRDSQPPLSGGSNHVAPPTFHTVVFSPDGKLLVAQAERLMRVWRAEGSPKVGIVPASGISSPVTFSPDGKLLCAGNEGGILHFWDIKTGALTRLEGPPSNPILQVAFSTDGKTVASADGYAKTVRLWDVAKRKFIKVAAKLSGEARGVAFGATNEQLGCAHHGSADRLFEVLDLATEARTDVKLPNGMVTSVHALPQSQSWLVLQWMHHPVLTFIPFAAPHAPASIALAQGSDGSIPSALTISPDERFAAVSTKLGAVQIVDLRERTLVRQLHGPWHSAGGIAFSPDGRFLASADAWSFLRVWGTEDFPFPLDASLSSPDGKPGTKKNR